MRNFLCMMGGAGEKMRTRGEDKVREIGRQAERKCGFLCVVYVFCV